MQSASIVVILNNVKKLDNGLFDEHTKLKKVVFQKGSRLETIETGCFGSSGIEELVAPVSLRTIRWGAFNNCK